MNSTTEPSVGALRRAILPPKGLLLCLMAQAPLSAMAWPLAPTAMEMAWGAAMLVAGVALNLWADASFRRHGVGVCPFTPVGRLIDDGPFRYTRNPMYVGLVLIAAGATLATGVIANLWAPLTYALWLQFRFMLPEETFLREQLGESFERYANRTPRWIGVPARTDQVRQLR